MYIRYSSMKSMDPNMGLNFIRGLCNGPKAGNELKKGPNIGPVLDFLI